MDYTDASLNVINLICTTLVFIQEVTKASPSSSSASSSLAQAHSFLETFSDLCFGDVTGLLRDARVAQSLVLDTCKSLHALNKALAAHREAWRYINVASEVKRHPMGRQRASTIAADVDGQKKIWRDEMKYRSQLWREKAGAEVHPLLFETEEMDTLRNACDTWIGRLRNTLSIVLLIAGEPSPHCPTKEQATRLGIAHMLERQRRLGLRPSENYRPLSGQLRKAVSSLQPIQGFMKTVYSDEYEETDVVVEVRPYSDTPAGSIRQLTWYLSASSALDTPTKQHETLAGYNMLTLTCLGYMDDPSNARSLILYRSPRSHPWASNPPSLHDLISRGWTSKLSLSLRFKSARTLVSSVLDIHTSGSLHSNVNSKGIAMLPRDLNDTESSPYLLGWGVEMPSSDTMSPLEPNLYRHRTQFGQMPRHSTTEQDIYSLGVVLLEIGLWTTMSTVFAKLLETTPHFGAGEEKAIFKKVYRVILDLAYSSDLQKEMGHRYATVVKSCLEWSHEDAVESMLDFRRRIVDALDVGCKL